MAWSFSSEQTDTVGAFESCEEEEAGEEEGAANEGASSDEGEPPGGRSQHLHAIASHPQREQRVTESSGSEKVRARVVGGAASSSSERVSGQKRSTSSGNESSSGIESVKRTECMSSAIESDTLMSRRKMSWCVERVRATNSMYGSCARAIRFASFSAVSSGKLEDWRM